jgi:hypothetical protein
VIGSLAYAYEPVSLIVFVELISWAFKPAMAVISLNVDPSVLARHRPVQQRYPEALSCHAFRVASGMPWTGARVVVGCDAIATTEPVAAEDDDGAAGGRVLKPLL